MRKLKTILISMLLAVTSLSGCKGRQNAKVQWSKWFDNGDGLTHTRHNLNDITQEETENHVWELLFQSRGDFVNEIKVAGG